GRAGPAAEVRPTGDANAVLGHRCCMLRSSAEQRHVGDTREVGGEEAADHTAADHPDAVGQGVPPARIVASFDESMFPPETTQTTSPVPPRPASAAASESAPAPSATTLTRSAKSLTAAAVSSIGTATAPSSTL